jgi:hypothetical protein
MTPNMTLNRWRAVLDLYGGDVFLDRITIEAGRLVTSADRSWGFGFVAKVAGCSSNLHDDLAEMRATSQMSQGGRRVVEVEKP